MGNEIDIYVKVHGKDMNAIEKRGEMQSISEVRKEIRNELRGLMSEGVEQLDVCKKGLEEFFSLKNGEGDIREAIIITSVLGMVYNVEKQLRKGISGVSQELSCSEFFGVIDMLVRTRREENVMMFKILPTIPSYVEILCSDGTRKKVDLSSEIEKFIRWYKEFYCSLLKKSIGYFRHYDCMGDYERFLRLVKEVADSLGEDGKKLVSEMDELKKEVYCGGCGVLEDQMDGEGSGFIESGECSVVEGLKGDEGGRECEVGKCFSGRSSLLEVCDGSRTMCVCVVVIVVVIIIMCIVYRSSVCEKDLV